ncbi:MAG: RNA polymerase sigma factor [Bacteroidetes bacterium]|jgi:RNA polymerase sigma-70 factor (ECF subfamily)|nr:RNA polymerase sigma factor [Bacteroidota bacterium]
MLNNEKLFRQLYDEHSKMVYNISLQYLQNIEEAEDVTQEVFVKVYQNLEKFNATNATFKTWIYRIAINQNLDVLKTKKAKKRLGFITSIFYKDTNEPLTELVHFNHPGVALENKELMEKLFSTINDLSENQRTVIILLKIEGLSQKEVGNIMNMSIKAIESLFQRAKKTLYTKLYDKEG